MVERGWWWWWWWLEWELRDRVYQMRYREDLLGELVDMFSSCDVRSFASLLCGDL